MPLTRDHMRTIAARTDRPVKEAWSPHDKGRMGWVEGVMLHHTGTRQDTASDAPTLKVVRDGRTGLENALCNFYIAKDGTIYLITEKVAWHAGVGSWRGITDGNGRFLGIEPESDGKVWTEATIESYVRLVAEICRFLGVDPHTWTPRHAQWAPGRKVDFGGLDETRFRARVAARIANPDGGFLMALTDAQQAELYRMVSAIHHQEKFAYDYRSHPDKQVDDQYGQTMSIRRELAATRAVVEELAKRQGLSAEDIEALVTKLLREQVVKVDVDVRSAPKA